MRGFAHTPQALEQILCFYRLWVRGRIILVFDCPGERDAHKRPVDGVLSRIVRRFYCRSEKLLWVRPLNGLVIPVQSRLSPEIRRFTEVTREFRRLYQQFTSDVGFVGRFVQGVSCDVAFVGGLPVGFVWCSRVDAGIGSLNAALWLGEGDSYLMEIYVSPTSRGKGLARIMLEPLHQELFEDGYRRVVVLSDLGNLSVFRLNEKLGYQPHHRLSFWRLAPFEWLTASACRPEDAGTLAVNRATIGFLPFRRPRWVLSMRGPGRCDNVGATLAGEESLGEDVDQ